MEKTSGCFHGSNLKGGHGEDHSGKGHGGRSARSWHFENSCPPVGILNANLPKQCPNLGNMPDWHIWIIIYCYDDKSILQIHQPSPIIEDNSEQNSPNHTIIYDDFSVMSLLIVQIFLRVSFTNNAGTESNKTYHLSWIKN